MWSIIAFLGSCTIIWVHITKLKVIIHFVIGWLFWSTLCECILTRSLLLKFYLSDWLSVCIWESYHIFIVKIYRGISLLLIGLLILCQAHIQNACNWASLFWIHTNRILVRATISFSAQASLLSRNIEIIKILCLFLCLTLHNVFATKLFSIKVWCLNHWKTFILISFSVTTSTGISILTFILVLWILTKLTPSFSLACLPLRGPNFFISKHTGSFLDT